MIKIFKRKERRPERGRQYDKGWGQPYGTLAHGCQLSDAFLQKDYGQLYRDMGVAGSHACFDRHRACVLRMDQTACNGNRAGIFLCGSDLFI